MVGTLTAADVGNNLGASVLAVLARRASPFFGWGKEEKCVMHYDARVPGAVCGPLGFLTRWTV